MRLETPLRCKGGILRREGASDGLRQVATDVACAFAGAHFTTIFAFPPLIAKKNCNFAVKSRVIERTMTRFDVVKPLGLIALLLISLAAAPTTRPTKHPTTQPAVSRDLEVTDVAGHASRLLGGDAKAVVLFFVGTECPVSNGYAPEISRLAKAYGAKGVSCYVVYSGTDVDPAAAAKHAKEYKFTCPALVDSKCELANAVGAKITLEAAVVLPDGSVAYRGRIDDQYVTLGRKRFAPTTHDLQDVLDAVVAGKPVEPRFTQAVGCSIVMPEGKKP